MRKIAFLLIVIIAYLTGCYANWQGGEDLDAKAREISNQVIYSKVWISEEPVKSLDQDSSRITIKFYFRKQLKTISYYKYFIPAKYINLRANQFSGYLSEGDTLEQAKHIAEETLINSVLKNILLDLHNRNQYIELTKGYTTPEEKISYVIDKIKQEDPSVIQIVSALIKESYSKYVVPPDIEEEILDYLIRGKVLDNKIKRSYYNYACLAELTDSDKLYILRKIDSILNNLFIKYQQETFKNSLKEIWQQSGSVFLNKLGPNGALLSLSDSLQDIANSLKIEIININKSEPNIRLRAIIKDKNQYLPCSQAVLMINGNDIIKTDNRGIIQLDSKYLMTKCFNGRNISVKINFGFLYDLATELSRRRISTDFWNEIINSRELAISFRFEGKGQLSASSPSYQIIEAGLIIKKPVGAIITGTLKANNYVPVKIKSAFVKSTFYNESLRRPVDYYEIEYPVNVEIKGSHNYKIEMNKPAFVEKLKKYKQVRFEILFKAIDSIGNEISVEAK